SAGGSMDEMYSNQMKVYAQLAELDGTVGDSTITQQSAVLAGRPADAAQFVGDSQKALDQAIAALASVQPQLQVAETHAIAETTANDLADLKAARADVFAALKTNGPDAAMAVARDGLN